MPRARWDDDLRPQSGRATSTYLIESAVLNRKVVLGPYVRGNLRYDMRFSPEWGEMLLEIETEVLRHELPPASVTASRTVELARPASWWDHFKMQYAGRWWMRWWVRRRPARAVLYPYDISVTADLRRWAKFPYANVPVEEFGPLRLPFMHYELGRTVQFRAR